MVEMNLKIIAMLIVFLLIMFKQEVHPRDPTDIVFSALVIFLLYNSSFLSP